MIKKKENFINSETPIKQKINSDYINLFKNYFKNIHYFSLIFVIILYFFSPYTLLTLNSFYLLMTLYTLIIYQSSTSYNLIKSMLFPLIINVIFSIILEIALIYKIYLIEIERSNSD